jgi:hypothetical protein
VAQKTWLNIPRISEEVLERNLIGYRVHTGSGAHPAYYPVDTRGFFPGGEADHSPPSIAEVKECVVLYLHSSVPLHGVVISYNRKHRDNFTFTENI